MQTATAPDFVRNGQFADEARTARTPESAVVANEAADGYVVIDGVQFVPVRIANAERTGKHRSG